MLAFSTLLNLACNRAGIKNLLMILIVQVATYGYQGIFKQYAMHLILLWDVLHCWIPLRSSVLSGCAGNVSPAEEQRTALSVTSART